MRSNQKKPVSRRDFLKGVGLAGSGALLTFMGGREIQEVQAGSITKGVQPSIPNGIPSAPSPVDTFLLEVSGLSLSKTFDQCTNFGIETEIVNYQDGSELFLRNRPGRTKYQNILLERGLTSDMAMWNWLEAVYNGANFRFNASLKGLDEFGATITQWDLFECWPSEVYAMLSRTGSDPYAPEMRERTVLTLESLERVA